MKEEELIIKVPKGYYNWAITTDNHFIADTNNSANWDDLKFPLPEGNWSIHWVKLTTNEAILKNKTT